MGAAPLEAVVFDVDGTLADTELEGHRLAFNAAFAELGLPFSWDVGTYRRLLAVTGGERRLRCYLSTAPEALAYGWSAEEVEDLAAELHRRKTAWFLEQGVQAVAARPGASRVLEGLRREGVALAVATTGSPEWVHPLLDRLFGKGAFTVVVTGREAPRRKPDPAAYCLALEQLGVPPSRAVAIEDSGPGVRAARAASLPVVVVAGAVTEPGVAQDADLALGGYGEPEQPAEVLHDPFEACPDGILGPGCLRRLRNRVASGFLPFEG
ncbi:HAD-IA family hydrolase [Aciditerrimonas ferrireducens]|uniref:HAD-IA family hydrolase n=1 Tax=Aciditerrimonas ferrireducens TaxID=667306 RepID=UPI002002D5DD|nr:HAD-IA family hydrolase [Aciditerrimonas ferrireducens]MCK4177002.1 HAD-IA family hydrolase [Aciditerrimonas ferrireducens]